MRRPGWLGGTDAVSGGRRTIEGHFFHINSPGGSITAGLAIYDTMRYIRCDVSTICIGLAPVSAHFAGRRYEGKTVCAPNAEIMIHQPAVEKIGGKATDIQIYSEKLQRDKRRLNRILAENTGENRGGDMADTERDHFMSAEEAKAYGIIDAVMQKEERT